MKAPGPVIHPCSEPEEMLSARMTGEGTAVTASVTASASKKSLEHEPCINCYHLGVTKKSKNMAREN